MSYYMKRKAQMLAYIECRDRKLAIAKAEVPPAGCYDTSSAKKPHLKRAKKEEPVKPNPGITIRHDVIVSWS